MNISVSENITVTDSLGRAIQLNGSTNYVSIGTLGNLGSNLGSGLYIRFDIVTTSTSMAEFGVWVSGTGNNNVFIGLNQNQSEAVAAGKLGIMINAADGKRVWGATTNATSFNDGNKHTLVFTLNPSTNIVTISVDGSNEAITYSAQQTPTVFANLPGAFWIGARNYNSTVNVPLACTIDNFYIGTSPGDIYGYYKFDEGVGLTAIDSSAKGNNGTLSGSPTPTWTNRLSSQTGFVELNIQPLSISVSNNVTITESLSRDMGWGITVSEKILILEGGMNAGTALLFNGNTAGQRITPSDQTKLKIGTSSDITFGANLFINKKESSPYGTDKHTLLSSAFNYAGNNGYAFQLGASDGSITVFHGSTSATSSTGLFNYGTRISVIFRIKGTNARAYINGTQVFSTTITRVSDAIANAFIGEEASSFRTGYFLIDNFFSVKSALSEAQILNIATRDLYPSGLDIKWSINEGTGSSVTDSSGNSNTGTITGATWVPSYRSNNIFFPTLGISVPKNNKAGFSTHLEGLSYPSINAQLELMASANTKWIRLEFLIGNVQAVEGVFTWDKYDYIVQKAINYGIQVNALISQYAWNTPTWARVAGTTGNFLIKPDKYVALLTAVATQYNGIISHYELGNEPNLNGFWGNTPNNPTVYSTDYLQPGYDAIKAVNANNIVISAGLSPGATLYARAMFQAGAAGHFDIFGTHPYVYPSAPNFTYADQLQAIMNEYGEGAKQQAFTEVGWPTHVGSTGVSEATQATYISQLISMYANTTNGKYRPIINYYDFKEDGTTVDYNEHHFGIVTYDLSRLKPAYYAFQSTAGENIEEVFVNESVDIILNSTRNINVSENIGVFDYRRNYATNPNFEGTSATFVNTSATAGGDYSGLSNALRDTTWKYDGTYAAKEMSKGSTGQYYMNSASAFTPIIGATYTFSARVYIPTGSPITTVKISIRDYTTYGEIGVTTATLVAGQWTRISASATATLNNPQWRFTIADPAGCSPTNIGTYWIDTILVERSASMGEYFDGSNGGSWVGAANASESISADSFVETALVHNIRVSESVSISESQQELFTGVVTHYINKSESISLTENVQRLLTSSIDKSDSISITESVSNQIISNNNMLSKVGSTLSPTSTGNLAVTGIGFQPKAILLWTVGTASDGNTTDHRISWGVATSSTNRWTSGSSGNDGGNNSARVFKSNKVISVVNHTPTVQIEADLVSMDADGFTLNWTTVQGTQIQIFYIAIGGNDISAKAGTYNTSGSTGNQNITGVGFQPDLLFFGQSLDNTSEPGASYFWWEASIAKSSGSKALLALTGSNDTSVIESKSSLITSKILRNIYAGTTYTETDLVSKNSDGFTINNSVVTQQPLVGYLAIKGVNSKIGTFSENTSTGNQSVVGVGFQPELLFFMSRSKASGTTSTSTATAVIGAATSSTNRWSISSSRTESNPYLSDRRSQSSKVLTHLSAGTPILDAEADFVSMDSDGFTINMTTADGVSREVVYLALASQEAPPPSTGTLTVNATNGRWFDDGSGNAIVLVGSHNWWTFQNYGTSSPPSEFNFSGYLDFLQGLGHNFTRGWYWESPKFYYTNSPYFPGFLFGDNYVDPMPWERTGPGTANDGGLKFDLDTFNQDFFDRLRQRVIDAGARGIYYSVMLFQGFSLQNDSRPPIHDAWQNHPFNSANNINSVDGDPGADGEGYETHLLAAPTVLPYQEAYVQKVIDTLNDLDNVFWEIANESVNTSDSWQEHMVDFIHTYESTKPKQHLVCYSVPLGTIGISLAPSILDSNAEVVSLGVAEYYKDDPPENDGSHIIINDTDHNWGIGGNRNWAWKSFTHGLHPIYMDGWSYGETDAEVTSLRANLGYIRQYSEKINLAQMSPQAALSNTGYILAKNSNPGEYLSYRTNAGDHVINLSSVSGDFTVEWFNPANNSITMGSNISGGGSRTLTPPFSGDSVLYLKSTLAEFSVAVSENITITENKLVSGPPATALSVNVSENITTSESNSMLRGGATLSKMMDSSNVDTWPRGIRLISFG